MPSDPVWDKIQPKLAIGALEPFGIRMDSRIRAFDWSTTSMGSSAAWPESLKAVVSMMLISRQPICMFWGPDLNLLYNDAYAPFLGAREAKALGKPFRVVWGDVWDSVEPFVVQALSGEGTWTEDMRLLMTRNGFEEETFWTFSYSPLIDDEGRIAGLIDIATDSTSAVLGRAALERSREAAERDLEKTTRDSAAQQVIHQEMAHRIKNILAMTMAVISQTLRNSPDLALAEETISRRIAALARAQDVMTIADLSNANVATVIRESLNPHLDRVSRARLSGPEVIISSQQALGLALAVHEMATNAVKYGALSNADGRLNVSWTFSKPAGSFSLEWHEEGGPEVIVPSRSGFGSKLVNKIVPNYFGGRGFSSYDPTGFRYRLEGSVLPLSSEDT